MTKGFWKGFGYSFLAGSFLNLLLVVAFNILQKMGIIHTGANNPFLILGIYAIVLLIYIITAKFYFKQQSSKNLEKLKKEVENVTGRKLI